MQDGMLVERALPLRQTAPRHGDMVWIPGGEFLMGSDRHYPEEAPAHRVRVDGFWMDGCTVTNRDFESPVVVTGSCLSTARRHWTL